MSLPVKPIEFDGIGSLPNMANLPQLGRIPQ